MNDPRKEKRPPRTPLTPDEVAELVYLKKVREQKKLQRFKKSSLYKAFNVVNILCFFIYCEMICCFIGPVSYQSHYSKQVLIEYGEVRSDRTQRVIEAVTLNCVNNERFLFDVDDFITPPDRFSEFEIGSDFLLGKEIKGRINTDGEIYSLVKASPILFLSIFVGILSLILFFFDLNENVHSLSAITAINLLTVLAFIFI